MKFKNFFIFLIVFIGMIGIVQGVCVTPTEGLTVSSSIVLCTGTYRLNDSDVNGVLNVSASNLIIDLNGSLIYGNNIASSKFLGRTGGTKNNVTIKNGRIENYSLAVANLFGNNMTWDNVTTWFTIAPIFNVASDLDFTIKNGNHTLLASGNMVFANQYSTGQIYGNSFQRNSSLIFNFVFAIQPSTALGGSYIMHDNKYFYTDAIQIASINGTNSIYNEQFYLMNGTGFASIYLKNTQNVSINNITSRDSYSRIIFQNTSGSIIANSSLINNTGVTSTLLTDWILLNQGSQYNIVDNNNIRLSSIGVELSGSNNNNITNNNITNIWTDADTWDTNIRVEFSNNTLIKNNILINVTGVGALLRRSHNTSILNLNCSGLNISSKNPLGIYDFGEPTGCIYAVELYKGFLGDSTENLVTDNVTRVSTYASDGLSLTNITYDDNIQIILKLQGTINVYHNLTNYWYRKINLQDYLTNASEYYINNAVNQLQVSTANYPNKPGNTLSSIIQYGYASQGLTSNTKFNYSIGKTQINITNQNETNTARQGIDIYSAFAFYPFNDVFNVSSNSVLQFNVDNFSTSLIPNQQIQVGDFSNLTSFNFNSPSDFAGNYLRNYIMVNVTMNGSGFSNLSINLYNSSFDLINSNYSTSNQSFVNFTSLPDGTYFYNVSAYDLAGQVYYSQTIGGLLLGSTPLTITITSPTSTTYTTTGVLIDFNATSPFNISQLWFFNGSGNMTYTTPFTINLSDGTYTMIFYANDSLNIRASSNVLFSVNTNPFTCADKLRSTTITAQIILVIVFIFIAWLMISADAGLTSLVILTVLAYLFSIMINAFAGAC